MEPGELLEEELIRRTPSWRKRPRGEGSSRWAQGGDMQRKEERCFCFSRGIKAAQ